MRELSLQPSKMLPPCSLSHAHISSHHLILTPFLLPPLLPLAPTQPPQAHKILVGAIEAQTNTIIDAFHSLIPRELVEKYNFTSLEMQLLVCGEQRVDIQDLRRSCKWVLWASTTHT